MEDMRTVTCSPEQEIEAVRIMESFGYYLHSSNEVYNKDTNSSLETDIFDNVYQKTTETVVHYVKMVFRRKQDIPNYNELKRLEQEYDNCKHPGEKPQAYGILAIFIGLCLCTIPGVFMIVWNCTSYKKKKEEYAIALTQYENERNEILKKARALVC